MPPLLIFWICLWKGAMRSILMGKQGTSNYCYLPMPFDKSASMKMIYKREKVFSNLLFL